MREVGCTTTASITPTASFDNYELFGQTLLPYKSDVSCPPPHQIESGKTPLIPLNICVRVKQFLRPFIVLV